MTEVSSDIYLSEVIDYDSEVACDIAEDCSREVRWIGIARCCHGVDFACDEHKRRFLVWQSLASDIVHKSCGKTVAEKPVISFFAV